MGESDGGQSLLFLLVVVLGFLLLVVRPQRARARALRAVREQLAPGVRVMTTAGLYAEVVSVDDGVVVLEAAPGVHLRFDTGAVVRIVTDPAPAG